MQADRKGRWGWMFFDWASQPYHTLLITFIFAPYFTGFVAVDEVQGQAIWGYMLATAGLLIALMAPVLGAIADASGPRKPWVFGFSILYVIGSASLWYAVPGMENPIWILLAFGLGLIGLEFATTFNNAMLPDLVPEEEVGALSGSGWALGYVGGLMVLIFVLLLLNEGDNGMTLLGIPPIFGLDPAMLEGKRSSGPVTAVWYILFMIPFFLWVPDIKRRNRLAGAVRSGISELVSTVRSLPDKRSLSSYLLSSMFYRDALNGLYSFGGIYGVGVLGWSITQIGIFGILANITGAIGAWIGGRMDRKLGPKPVIVFSILALTLVVVIVVATSRDSFFGVALADGSTLPDIIFYICGGIIGAAGGTLQASSRTMMVHQAEPGRMTEGFGLYALTGKATAFLAPLAIAVMTDVTGSQRLGVTPIIALFAIGLVLLYWVKPKAKAPT